MSVNGVVEAQAHVAQPLSNELARQISDRVSALVNRNVILRQVVDPKLIGGLKIRVGDTLIDGSVATQLKLMREGIAAQGREAARTNLEKILVSP